MIQIRKRSKGWAVLSDGVVVAIKSNADSAEKFAASYSAASYSAASRKDSFTTQILNSLEPDRAYRIASLRQQFKLPAHQLDAALHELHSQSLIALYPENNASALTAADKRAALLVGGEPRHILYRK
jgi:hypothetical protein